VRWMKGARNWTALRFGLAVGIEESRSGSSGSHKAGEQ